MKAKAAKPVRYIGECLPTTVNEDEGLLLHVPFHNGQPLIGLEDGWRTLTCYTNKRAATRAYDDVQVIRVRLRSR